jgi:hypothetical protein
VFLHDDVHLCDFRGAAPARGSEQFHVVGSQATFAACPGKSWAFVNNDLKWDSRANLSGSVAHGPAIHWICSSAALDAGGQALDGLMLACKTAFCMKRDPVRRTIRLS